MISISVVTVLLQGMVNIYAMGMASFLFLEKRGALFNALMIGMISVSITELIRGIWW